MKVALPAIRMICWATVMTMISLFIFVPLDDIERLRATGFLLLAAWVLIISHRRKDRRYDPFGWEYQDEN
jgi:hypothetical protein